MLLSEIIIRRHIRRILAEDVGREGGVPTSTAVDTSGKSTLTGTAGGKRTLADKIALGFLALPTAMKLKDLFFGDDSSDPGLRDAKKQFKAAVCGDSQAQGPLGQETEKLLKGEGYTVIRAEDTTYKPGAAPGAVLNFVKANARDSILIVAIFGGNGSPETAKAAAEEMQKVCDESLTTLLVIGPPVTTRITDPKVASKMSGADHYTKMTPDTPQSPAYRRSISASMQTAAVDGRAVKVYGIASQYSGYPDQPDGLHCYEGEEGVIAAAMTFFGLAAITASLRKVIQGQGQRKGRSATTSRKLSSTQDTLADMKTVGMGSKDTSSSPDISKFSAGILKAEGSRANLQTFNPESKASGKYQFVPSQNTDALISVLKAAPQKYGYDQVFVTSLEAEYKKPGKFSAKYNDTKSPIRKVWDDFLNSENMQEDLFEKQSRVLFTFAQKYKTQYASNEVVQALSVAQLAGIAHLFGAGGLKDQIITGNDYGAPFYNGQRTVNSTAPVYIDRFSQGYYGSDY